MSKLVYDIGLKGTEYPACINKEVVKEYSVWKGMLLRCTEKFQTKYPTYAGTSCSDNFKSYSYFYEWCQEQVGFGNLDDNSRSWHLDKDLLIKGNKLYGENLCIFIPSRINNILTKCDSSRGKHPIGVTWNKQDKVFKAMWALGEIGRFNTAEEAFQAYKKAKESYIKQVAEQYKSQIDPRAYKALLEYEVHIDD